MNVGFDMSLESWWNLVVALGWRIVPCWYALISLLTFLEYGRDKLAAKCGWWRTSERYLHRLEMLGGWPGGWLGQIVFHHKCSKRSYQNAFLGMAVFNIIVLSIWLWFVFDDEAVVNWFRERGWL